VKDSHKKAILHNQKSRDVCQAIDRKSEANPYTPAV
jgi:hypothetical protein